MTIEQRLEALAKGPKPWLATIWCADGTVRTLRQPREAMALAHVERLSRKCGFVRGEVTYQPE